MLARYLAPQRLRVVLLAILLLGSIGLQLLNPQILRSFIATVTGSGPQGGVLGIAALFLVLAVFQQVLYVGATWASERVAWTATNSLRADLALHCLRLDLGFHKARTPGELIERIDGDVTALANFFSQFVVQILGSLLLLLGVLTVLWTTVDWRVGGALTVFAFITLGAMLGLRTIATRFWKAHRQASAELFGFVEEHLAGTVDIRANGAQPYALRRLYGFMRERFQTGRKARLASSIPWSIPSLAEALGTGIAFALAVALYAEGADLGTAFVIYFYTQALFQPMHMLSNQLEDFQKASAGAVRVQELMSTRSALTDGRITEFAPGAPDIEFRDVTFAYEGDDNVIHDLTFRVAPGEVVGLLGRTGSGKTTVTRLLLRLYDPTAGSIMVGGVELRDAELAALRRQIGMVTQDVQLFRGSIRDNLTFFDDTVPEPRIWEALEALGLVEWCRALPQGLDTVIEGGGGLSAGEAQLLAFTRVFLKDPGLVILDEASSRLDPVTERLVERAVAGLLRGRTGIIIAHRLSTVDRADTILILEQGAIAEYGPRHALVSDPASRFSQLLRTGVEEVLV